jgi:acyl-CoA synthetase (NDP forming)
MHALEKLIRPRSVAIIGASADPNKLTRDRRHTVLSGYRILT